MSALSVTNVCKSYSVKRKKIEVNKNICLHIPPASLVWIYGNSGAGKSTFLNLITGIDTPDSGSIQWGEHNVCTMNTNARSQFRLEHCGLIFQFFELIKAQTIYENAALPLKIKRQTKKEINKTLMPLFETFGLTDLIYKKPNELSGGERQRVSIVRALANEPHYIIADEITSSLDENRSNQVYDYMRSYLKEKNGIGIFVSHDPIINKYADAVYKMQSGALSESSYGGNG
ncbi:ABC transporter ATP-binding protein [Treponema pedis]|uniref:ABC transporter ATP-binding protein n=1 Tax=Treponema pedis TaxID=409322 RepID=UPI000412B33C|nr:ABC transporter ATP-binding protein [Treponema pedis]